MLSRRDLAIIVVLLIVAGLPRLLDLGTFLTADEKNWIGRSYEFIRAFKDWRFNDMLQTTHPGVTTLWVVGLSITAKMLTAHIPFSSANLSNFVFAAQLPIALLTTVSLPVIYYFLWPLLGRRVALLACLLLALDPFVVGHSRVAHVDALLAHFLFISAVALLRYRQRYEQRWLVIAALFAGGAFLTKVPAVFLIPFWWLVAASDRRAWRWQGLNARARDFLMWFMTIGLLFVTLWPAILWVQNPKGNVLTLKRDIGQAALTPHHMVEDYTLNAWHYPATLLTRTTPVTLVFTIIFVVWVFWQTFRREVVSQLPVIRHFGGPAVLAGQLTTPWLLLGFIFFFIVMMTLGAKKGDRYLLPIWPALAVMTALGLQVFSQAVSSRFLSSVNILNKRVALWAQEPHLLFSSLSAVVVLYLAFTIASYHPYEIAYASPLFPDNVSQELGWGEGLEQVAAWLNAQAPRGVVASWYPEELAAYTSAHVAHINAHQQGKVRYVVLYRNMFGRAPDHYANDFIDEYYTKRHPVFVARVTGKEFAWVYEKWSFEGIVGELLPGVRVTQVIPSAPQPLFGIDVLPATYSSTVTAGELVVRLQANGTLVQEWRTPTAQLGDNEWLTLALDQPRIIESGRITVEVSAAGTVPGNAPTVRITRTYDYRAGDVGGTIKPQGDLAIRLRYLVAGQPVTEEEGKLLQTLKAGE